MRTRQLQLQYITFSDSFSADSLAESAQDVWLNIQTGRSDFPDVVNANLHALQKEMW